MNDNILERIDAALGRMRGLGHDIDENGDPCEHYERLKSKRDAIAGGSSYATYSIAPYLIAYVGAHIPDVNFKRDVEGNHILVSGRGKKDEAALNAVINISTLRKEAN